MSSLGSSTLPTDCTSFIRSLFFFVSWFRLSDIHLHISSMKTVEVVTEKMVHSFLSQNTLSIVSEILIFREGICIPERRRNY